VSGFLLFPLRFASDVGLFFNLASAAYSSQTASPDWLLGWERPFLQMTTSVFQRLHAPRFFMGRIMELEILVVGLGSRPLPWFYAFGPPAVIAFGAPKAGICATSGFGYFFQPRKTAAGFSGPLPTCGWEPLFYLGRLSADESLFF